MGPSATGVLVLAYAPQKGFLQYLCPQCELQLSPASLGGSLRSAYVSDPASFQITTSALCLRTCGILGMPFKSVVSIFYSPLTLLKLSPTGLQSQIFWLGFIFPVQDPWFGEPEVGLRPLTPGVPIVAQK